MVKGKERGRPECLAMKTWVQVCLQPTYLVHPSAWFSPLVLGAACAVSRGLETACDSGLLQSWECSGLWDALFPSFHGFPKFSSPCWRRLQRLGVLLAPSLCWVSAQYRISHLSEMPVSHVDPFSSGSPLIRSPLTPCDIASPGWPGCPVLPHVPALGVQSVLDQLPAW